ncbi:MAG: leucine-rich repeat protein [Peptococcaceae bacterium]|nr:leucine-rich repeat protein [Peptococcaceae bacterium]
MLKTNTKKKICMILIVSMLFSILPVSAFAEENSTVTSGSCGENTTWQFDSATGTLTITGNGDMDDYLLEERPWEDHIQNIEKIVIEDGVTSVGSSAFDNATELKNVSLASTVKSINHGAFSGCRQLKEITIPESVTTIESGAFAITGLTSITIPAITELKYREDSGAGYTFYACHDLKNIYVDEESILYSSRDGVLYSKDGTELLCYPAGKTASEFVIPNHVTHIANESIDLCDSLERLVFGENVVYCGGFGTNYNLQKIQLNEGLQTIAAMSCLSDNLTEPLYIPESVTFIGGQFAAYDNADVYFYGNAPAVDERFKDSGNELTEDVMLYYIEGKAGWSTPKWNGYNTKTWEGNSEEGETVKITKLSPANGAENVGYNSTNPPLFKITFNTEPSRINGEAVQLDETKEPFRIYRAKDDKLIYEESTDTDNTAGYSSNITSATESKTVTIKPTNRHILLEKDTEYYITIGEGYMKFADGSVSPAIEKGDWSFRTKNPDVSIVSDITIKTGDDDTKNAVVTVEWKDIWFKEPATTYRHELACTAMALSGAAYVENSNKQPAPDAIQDALTGFGFEEITSYNYDKIRSEERNDMVSYTFATKKDVFLENEVYNLVAVIVKGTSGDEEWYSNFNMGLENRHEGFNTAELELWADLSIYLNEHNLTRENTKFIVTGHSRGAAVANLIARDLSYPDIGKARAYADNVYAYTFATPAVTTDENATAEKYSNIFNVVSGEDFVTRVPLKMWNYGRYGVDLLLPSRSYYGRDYNKVYTAMTSQYNSLINKAYEPYNGTQQVDNLVMNVIRVAPTITAFYKNINQNLVTPSIYFNSLAEYLVTKNLDTFVACTISNEYIPITAFFIANHLVDKRVFAAHSMATYYSWLDSCSAEELFGDANASTVYWFKRATIACPVDVYVYDEGGNLVASVVDETVGANTLAVSVEDGIKTIDMPNDQEYTIKIVATDKGTVTYTIEENKATADGNDVLRTIRFNNIAIESGDELNGEVNDDTYTASKNYALTKNDGTDEETVIYSDYDSKTQSNPSSPSSGSGGGFSGVYNYPIKVDKVDGAEIVLSDEYASKGEDVSILVKPDTGKEVGEVTVTDARGNVLSVTKTADNQYSFTMPSGKVNVQVNVKDAEYDLRIVMQIQNKNILAGDKTIVNDVAPVIVDDRTLVPIRVVTELLGGSAHWDAATRTVTLIIDGKVLSMTIDKPIPGFGTSAVIMNSRTYVPVRYVMEALGADVEWISTSQQVVIEK